MGQRDSFPSGHLFISVYCNFPVWPLGAIRAVWIILYYIHNHTTYVCQIATFSLHLGPIDEPPCTVSQRYHLLFTRAPSLSLDFLSQMILLLTKSVITVETRSLILFSCIVHDYDFLCVFISLNQAGKNAVSSFRAPLNWAVIFVCNVCLLAAQVYLQPCMLWDSLIVLTRLGTGCLLWISGFRDVKYCSGRMNLLRYLLAARREARLL